MTAADQVRTAAELLRSYDRVVLLAHVNPDADALGSALALGLALQRTGVHVQVSFGDPDVVPRSLRGLPGQDLIVPIADVVPTDLVVSLDVNSRNRLGRSGALLDSAEAVLVIDHHASNTGFGTHHLVDADAESTTVLVAAVLDELGLTLDREIADNLYAGLATDSVGFRHAGAEAYRLAARLLDLGVEPDELMRPITESHPAAYLTLLTTVLGRATVETVDGFGDLVWTSIDPADIGDLQAEELDSIIDIIRTTTGIRVAAVFKGTRPGRWQVSLRSLPGTDVAVVATALGGGGHRRAAGFSFEGTLAQARAALVGALSR